MRWVSLFYFAVMIAPGFSDQPWTWQSRGVGGGGALFAPSFSPHNADELFIACDMSELFHTTDMARNWDPIDFREIQGNRACRVQFTSDPQHLYAIDCTSIDGGDTQTPSQSLDGGTTWETLSGDPTSAGAYSLFSDITATNRLLVSDYENIYYSTNAGDAFDLKFNFPNGGNGCFIGGAFFSGTNIYIGCTAGLLISTDNGDTFSVSSVGGIPTSEEIISFCGAQQNGTTRLFCVTVDNGTLYPGILIEDAYYGSATHNIYSLDVGATNWTARTNGITGSDLPLFVSMAQNNIDTAYVAGDNGSDNPIVYKTTDGGASWESIMLTANNENVFTGWAGQSGDRGYSYDAYFVGFAAAPMNQDYAALTGYGFVHYTTNGGAFWNQGYVDPSDQNPTNASTPKRKYYHSVGLENTTSWWLTWINSNTMFACFSDITGIRSTNAGETWAFDFTGNSFNSTYQCHQHTNGTLYASVSTIHDLYQSTRLQDSILDAGDGEVKYSTDQGATWQTLHDFNDTVYGLALDPNNTNRLYAGVVHSTLGGILVSSNLSAGASSTWTALSAPPRTEGHPHTILVLNDGTLVCTYSGRRNSGGTFTASSGIFVSTNNGTSWTDRSHTNMYYWTKDVVLDPFDPSQSNWYVSVFSGWGGAPNNKGGLYRTADRGQTWTRLIDSDRVSSCTFNPANSNELFFTTEVEGLWYSSDIRATTPTFTQIENYPFKQPERLFFNPYNTNEVWITSFGHGLRVGFLSMEQPEFTQTVTEGNQLTIYWENNPIQTYSIWQSSDLMGTFTALVTNVTTNFYIDTSATNIAFFKITSP